VAHLDYEQVKTRVKVDKNFWDAVKANLKTVAEVEEWNEICSDNLQPIVQDAAFLAEAAKHLPDNLDFSAWMEAVKTATGKKGKDLFMPIRLALTAREHGPELKAILPLIGRERVLKRLG
jgi:glutamyl-tRNA synthetase